MTDIAIVNQRQWTADKFAQIKEIITEDEREPVVFGFGMANNGTPLTRRQMIAVRDVIDQALKDCPEARILLPR